MPTYRPSIPLKATSKSVLSQDVITTATIPVDSTSPAPVAVFTKPGEAANALPEALAIVNTGRGRQLCHIARDPNSDGGWSVTALFGGREADQVAACVAYAGTPESAVHGLFLQGNSIHSTSLKADGRTWEDPKVISGPPISNPRVAYSPGGRAVVYGSNANGNLVIAYQKQISGPFSSEECKTDGILAGGDFQLCMTSEQDWRILANVNGKAHLLSGILGAATASSSGPAPGFNEKVKQIALGYWSSTRNTVIYLIVGGDDSLHSWSQGDTESAHAQRIPNSSVKQATGYINKADGLQEEPLLHVYAVDSANRLWVLHQQPKNPWRDDGTPNWAPFLPLDKNVARLASDMNPAASPFLFALDGGDFSLRLHEMDSDSRLWKSQKLLQRSHQGFEVTRFRTEINVIDKLGVFLPNHKVKLSVKKGSSAVDVWAGGKVQTIDEDGVELATDATGKLTVAILTTAGLACPQLILSGEDLAEDLTIEPAGETANYLAGTGPLHPTNPGGGLSAFDEDGKALASAKVGGATLAPAASNQELARVGASAIRGAAMVGTNSVPAGVHGFAANFDTEAPRFHSFRSSQELHAFRTGRGLAAHVELTAGLGAFWGDIWEGIKNGVIAIKNFIVDVANKTVDLVIKIGEWISDTFHLALEGLEHAAHLIAGIFEFLGAQIHKVIDWLKALFDFKAIWHTKMALEEAILSVPKYVAKLAGAGRKGADKWFAKQKVDVISAFDEMKKRYEGRNFADSPNWQPLGGPPSSKTLVGGLAPADLTNNTHHNWLQDKVSAYAPSESVVTTDFGQEESWKSFVEHTQSASAEFSAALESFQNAMMALIKDPVSFAKTGVGNLIDAAKLLVAAMLDACGGMVDAMAALAQSAMQALDTLLNTELPLGPINSLWKWMAEQAGYPNDAKLTICSLTSLFGAFPVTILYKLANGVDREPFPQGHFPPLHVTRQDGLLTVKMPKECREISALLRMCQLIPATIKDIMNETAPWWLTLISTGFSIAIWVLANGYPELTGLQWASLSAVAANMLWILPAAYFILEAEAGSFLKKIKDNRGDITTVAFTILGVGSLAFGIMHDATDNLPLGEGIANILLPLTSVFSFLNLTAIRDHVEIAPFAIGAKVVFNVVSHLGGGSELLVAVSKSSATAAA